MKYMELWGMLWWSISYDSDAILKERWLSTFPLLWDVLSKIIMMISYKKYFKANINELKRVRL